MSVIGVCAAALTALVVSGCAPSPSEDEPLTTQWDLELDRPIVVLDVDDSTVWVGSVAGDEITAISAGTGDVRWSLPIGPGIAETFSLKNALVVVQVVEESAIVSALSSANGRMLWQQSAPSATVLGVFPDTQNLLQQRDDDSLIVVGRGGEIEAGPWSAPKGCAVARAAVSGSRVVALARCDETTDRVVLLDESLTEVHTVDASDEVGYSFTPVGSLIVAESWTDYTVMVLDEAGDVLFAGLATFMPHIAVEGGVALMAEDGQLMRLTADGIGPLGRTYPQLEQVVSGVSRFSVEAADGSLLSRALYSTTATPSLHAVTRDDYVIALPMGDASLLRRVTVNDVERAAGGRTGDPRRPSANVRTRFERCRFRAREQRRPFEDYAHIIVTGVPRGAGITDVRLARLDDVETASDVFATWTNPPEELLGEDSAGAVRVAWTDTYTYGMFENCVVYMIDFRPLTDDERLELIVGLRGAVTAGCTDD